VARNVFCIHMILFLAFMPHRLCDNVILLMLWNVEFDYFGTRYRAFPIYVTFSNR